MDFPTLTSRIRRRNNLARLISLVMATLLFIILVSGEILRFYPFNAAPLDDEQFMDRHQYYADLDGDRKSEHIVFTSYSGVPVMEVFASDEPFLDVIRISGDRLDNRLSFHVGDTDMDGFGEIYLLTIRNDSVLLNAFELLGDDGHFTRDLYVATYPDQSERNNLKLLDFYFVRLEGDRNLRVLFLIRAGYALTPRQLILVDPWTKGVRRSVNSAAGYNSLSVYRNDSGIAERVIAGASAFQNYDVDDTVLFNDNSGWLLSFAPDLSDTLQTMEFTGEKSYLFPVMKREDGQPFYYLIHVEMEQGKAEMLKTDLSGSLVAHRELGKGINSNRFMNAFLPGLNEIVILYDDTLSFYDESLELIRSEADAGDLVIREPHLARMSYINSNAVPFVDGDQLVFRDTMMNLKARCKTGSGGVRRSDLYMVRSYANPDSMVVAFGSDAGVRHYGLKRSHIYPFRGIIYILVFLVFYYFFFLLFRLQNYYYDRRNEARQRITVLQLQSIQNQLQPHFTFNVLNTIGSMIYKDRKEQAYEYLNYFSDMLRSTLLSRSSPEWQIGEELNFIDTYMEMENLRFDNRFGYSRQIGEGVDLTFRVPKMSIQSFAENAIRHGLMNKKGDCRLMVSVEMERMHVKCVVEDNGIGREAAAKFQRDGSGIGNSILQEYMDVYNKIHRLKFELQIEDLKDREGESSGTRVTVMIPRDYSSLKN